MNGETRGSADRGCARPSPLPSVASTLPHTATMNNLDASDITRNSLDQATR
jgi:hypothetical protein